jgi:hypothetical protein
MKVKKSILGKWESQAWVRKRRKFEKEWGEFWGMLILGSKRGAECWKENQPC